MRNENFLKMRVSEIRVKRIRVNQGLSVVNFQDKNLGNIFVAILGKTDFS